MKLATESQMIKKSIKCAECEKTFQKNCQLEIHMEEHGKENHLSVKFVRNDFS